MGKKAKIEAIKEVLEEAKESEKESEKVVADAKELFYL